MWRKLWAAVFGKRKARPVRASATTEAVVAPVLEVDTAEVAPAAEVMAVEAAPAVEAVEPAEVAPAVEVDAAEVSPAAEVVAVEAAPAVEAAEPVEVAPVAEVEPVEVAQAAQAAPAPEAAPAAAVSDGVWPELDELRRLAGIGPAPAPVVQADDTPAVAAMPEARFWSLIEATAEARAEGSEVQAEVLRAALEELSAGELVAFGGMLAGEMERANRWDLWGAAYVAHGGASDDGFAYFRLWLIGQGEAAFETVLADPDALARVVPRDADAALEFESLMYVAGDVWCERTGREAEEWPVAVDAADEPVGEPLEEDEAVLAERYPMLWKRFAEAPLG